MRYLIISVMLTGMTLLMHLPDLPSGTGATENVHQKEICLKNIPAGMPCGDTQAQQKFILVRGQPLPL